MTGTASIWIEDGEAKLASAFRTLGFCVREELTSDAGVVILRAADGGALPTRIRRRAEESPLASIIIVGDEPDPGVVAAAIRCGADDWVRAGVDLSRWKTVVKAALSRHRARCDSLELRSSLERSGQALDEDRSALHQRIRSLAAELELAHRQLQGRVSQLGMLYRIGRDLSSQRNWDEALQSLLAELCVFLDADGAALLLFSEGGQKLAARSSFQLGAEVLADAQQLLLRRGQIFESGGRLFSLETLESGSPVACEESTEAWAQTVLPLRHRDQTLGHLLLAKGYNSAHAFEEDHHFLITIQTILSEEVAGAQTLNELRRLRSLQGRILDNVGSAVFTLDRRGAVRYANRLAQELLGSDCEGLQLDSSLRVGGERVPLGEWLASTAAGPDISEGWIVAPGEPSIPVSILASALPTAEPLDPPTLIVVDDMRERRALEAERRRAAHQDELLIMAAEWAHDVRTPLTGILHGAELLADALGPDSPKRVHFTMIHGEVERINALVSNFLDFARPARLQLEAVSTEELLRQVFALLRGPGRDRGVDLEIDIDDGDWVCALDRDQLKQVLLNLVTNAFDACESGGSVVLRLRRQGVAPEGQNIDDCDGSHIIEIEDSGPGVPDAHIDRLFVPFFTTKQTGSGLGLAISDKIVRAHRGNLRYERRGLCSVFQIVIPVVRTPAIRHPSASDLPQEARG